VPDVSPVSRPTELIAAVDAAFSDRGALATAVEGYEPRAGQRRMAAAVAAVLEEGGTLLAEAGTGTTLAYLVPAILSRQRVLVSTGTKNLQEQIFFKDLPALRQSLGVPFTATLMKGRGNYLCLHRWDAYRQKPDSFERAVFLPVIGQWADRTATGDRAELRELPEDLPLWKDINAEAESCLGSDCPRWGDCWLTIMRQRGISASPAAVFGSTTCCAT
jgi:ATP-dependent DNA helicase DinG